MATQSAFVWDESFKANSDLSAKQFFCVKLTAADTVDLTSANSDRALGVLQDKPKSAHAGAVRILGMSKAVSDGSGTAISVNDYVGPDSNGRVVKKATADYSVMGIAMDASSAQGTVIRVLLMPGAWFRTAGG
jgi:hypothetical protein